METLLKLLVPIVMEVIGSILTPKNIKRYGEKLFSLLKDIIRDSETKWDDRVLLPVIKMCEKGLGLEPDGQEASNDESKIEG